MYEDFGINVVIKHLSLDAIDTYVRHLKALGVSWIRLELNFFSPVADEWTDRLVARARAENIQILGLLTGLVPGNLVNLIAPCLRFPKPMKVLDQYVSFCERMARRYQREITHWEIWNEENSLRFWIERPSPRGYVRMVQEVSALLRRINPENQIVMGALVGNDVQQLAPLQRMGFLQECLELGIDSFVDVYNFHPYIPACYLSRRRYSFYLPALLNCVEVFFNKYRAITKPIWITEFGVCPLWVRLSEEEIGQLYAAMYREMKRRGLKFFIWVLTDFQGPEYSRFNPETAFGLLDWQLRPKRMYHSLVRSLAAHL